MKELLAISSQFALNGAPIEVKPLGEGFINDTYIISTNADSYLLQRKNKNIFTNVPAMMDNIKQCAITLRQRWLQGEVILCARR